MTLMHFGNCYGLRSLETVLRALHRLRLRGLWPSAGVQLRNYGRVRARDVRLAAELGLSSIFQHRPAVGYRHGLAELASADLLVLLGYGEETGFIPAKTFDYLMVRRPILCVTTCPELGGIIHEAAGWAVAPADVEGAASVIASIVVGDHGSVAAAAAGDVGRFDLRATVKQLAGVLDDSVREHAASIRGRRSTV